MSFRRCTYPEILDRLLVSLVKGIAAEEHPYPPLGEEPYTHPLLKPPAVQLVSLFGSRDGQSHLFRAGSDYDLSEDKQSITWLSDGDRPDQGTVISVNYLSEGGHAQLNDLHIGSITRTLSEAIGLEISRLYAQLDVVYQSGFIDTSSGSALENLVALLSIERIEGGFPTGELEFQRVAGGKGAITIPAGTRIMDEMGEVEYETISTITLSPNQQTIRVSARDLERNDYLPAESLTVLAVPIEGIASVTNPAPTAISTEQESDGDLRNRAKNFLHGSERATIGAIRQAISRQQIQADIEESTTTPGLVEYTLHTDTLSPELEQRILTAIDSVRPAGVRVQPKGLIAPTAVNVTLRLITRADALEADLRAAQHEVQKALEDYFKHLPVKEDGRVNQIVGAILAISVIDDVELIDASLPDGSPILDLGTGTLALTGFPTTLGQLSMADPNLPTQLTVIIRFPGAEAPPDETLIRQALSDNLAYLNSTNADQPLSDAAIAHLTLGKWLWLLPLPNHAAQFLEAFDSGGGTLPTVADISPYEVTIAFSQEGGLTQELSSDGDSYTMAAYEQFTLASISLQVEGD